jgi:hypothetical protein
LSNKRLVERLARGLAPPPWFDTLCIGLLLGEPSIWKMLRKRQAGAQTLAVLQKIRIEVYEYRLASDATVRNKVEGARFMPGIGDDVWEEGVVWRRRRVRTVKIYDRGGKHALRSPTLSCDGRGAQTKDREKGEKKQ